MDEEDLAEAAEAQKVQTAGNFAGIGSTDTQIQGNVFIDIFKTQGETMGIKLLKKMGWREGQGVGPKVRRKARLDDAEGMENNAGTMHLFAPENTRMITFVKKNDHKGLGFEGEAKLSSNNSSQLEATKSDDEDEFRFGTSVTKVPKKKKPVRGGIGIGILNDTGSDDEDPYEIGPRISYNRVIGGEKKKKKATASPANPVLKDKPVFISKRAALAKTATSLRKCHDGRLPLDGFVLSSSNVSSVTTELPRRIVPLRYQRIGNHPSSRNPV